MAELLILKLVLVPPLIGAVSLAGRRWGPAVSGWLVGLPLSSAPISIFLAFEQGTAFAARAAQGTMLGLISVSAFSLAYAGLAQRLGWAGTVLVGWMAFLGATAILNQTALSLWMSFVMVAAVIALTLRLLPVQRAATGVPATPWWEIPLRIIAATGMVVGITAAASALGPQLSGLLSPFPVYATVLAVFTHHFQGPAAAGRLLRGMLAGLFSFATFFFIVSAGLQPWGPGVTFGLAAAVALLMHGVALRVATRAVAGASS